MISLVWEITKGGEVVGVAIPDIADALRRARKLAPFVRRVALVYGGRVIWRFQ